MNTNTKELIVIGTIGNQQKQIILSKENSFSDIYHIMIDKEYQGQVIKLSGQWSVRPHEKSWLKRENCDAILQAVLSAENLNQ